MATPWQRGGTVSRVISDKREQDVQLQASQQEVKQQFQECQQQVQQLRASQQKVPGKLWNELHKKQKKLRSLERAAQEAEETVLAETEAAATEATVQEVDQHDSSNTEAHGDSLPDDLQWMDRPESLTQAADDSLPDAQGAPDIDLAMSCSGCLSPEAANTEEEPVFCETDDEFPDDTLALEEEHHPAELVHAAAEGPCKFYLADEDLVRLDPEDRRGCRRGTGSSLAHSASINMENYALLLRKKQDKLAPRGSDATASLNQVADRGEAGDHSE